MLHVGLDVHTATSSFCILNADGKQVKSLTIKSGWKAVIVELKKIDQPFQIIYEASLGYGTLYEAITQVKNCRRAVVAHPGKLRLIFQSKKKNDRQDAKKLALLLMLNQAPAVHVPELDVRQWRRQIELRRMQVNKRTRTKNGLHAMLRTYGLSAPKEFGLWTVKGRSFLEKLDLPGCAGDERDLLLQELAMLDSGVKMLTKKLDERASAHAGVQLLRSIPGVGPRTAEAFVTYVDDPNRFTRSKQIGSYFGVVPCEDSSASRQRLGHITKTGPAAVRQLVVEASWMAIRKSPTIRAYFDRIVGEKQDRRKKALVATGHYLLRVMLGMLKSGEEWREAEALTRGEKLPELAEPEPTLREEELEDLAAA